MSLNSIGDLSRQFTSTRNTTNIKTDLAELVDAMSTGRRTDVTLELGGDTSRYAGIQYSIAQIDAYQQAAIETEQSLGHIQTILTKVDDIRSTTARQLLLVSDGSSDSQIDAAASAGRSAFDDIVSSLNTTIADRSLMGGNRVNTAPLAAPELMMADIELAVGSATDVATIKSRVDAWFDDPVGGFATVAYLGDSGAKAERLISQDTTVEIGARADDPGIKKVLKGAALAALANSLPGLDATSSAALLQDAAVGLQSSADDLAAVRSRVGYAEERVATLRTENSAHQTALELANNNIALADPFETASQLQSLQIQLETAFSITARMSQLSLLRYM